MSSCSARGSHKLQEMKALERCLLLTHNSSLITTSPGHNAGNQRTGSPGAAAQLRNCLWSRVTRVGEGLPASLGCDFMPSETPRSGRGRGARDAHGGVKSSPDVH